MTCIPADDAYLISLFPAVVQRQREKWMITVLAAQEGEYSVSLAGASFPADAVQADTVSSIRAKLAFALGVQTLAAVSQVGVASVQLDEVKPLGLAVTTSGPAPDTIEATLISGGDTNAAQRAFWLSQTLCSLPPCCAFAYGCASDYTLMHAAITAHWLFTMNNISGTGTGANDFDSMRLGPASLSRGKTAWSANPADGDLARTAPGQLFLQLRAKYVFPFVCV